MVSFPDPVTHVPRVGEWQRCYLNADAYVEGIRITRATMIRFNATCTLLLCGTLAVVTSNHTIIKVPSVDF